MVATAACCAVPLLSACLPQPVKAAAARPDPAISISRRFMQYSPRLRLMGGMSQVRSTTLASNEGERPTAVIDCDNSDRTNLGEEKEDPVRGDPGGRRSIKKKQKQQQHQPT